jgi:hypothetical protein
LWNPDRCNHPSVCRFLVHARSMPRPARTQGCLTRPVPPYPTRSNPLTAPTRSVVSDASPSFLFLGSGCLLPFSYPAGRGSAQILRRIAANTRLVRCPSASRRQSSRACFTTRPPVLTTAAARGSATNGRSASAVPAATGAPNCRPARPTVSALHGPNPTSALSRAISTTGLCRGSQ